MKEKLLKIKTLSERGGTEGEKRSAKCLFDKLCKKHGINPKDVREITDIEMSYSDGIKIIFKNGGTVYDHQFPNGAIVRYFVDGRRVVLREAIQRVRVINIPYGSVFGGSTTTAGGF